jgi:glutamine amidotransferase-like uncharacterized protein
MKRHLVIGAFFAVHAVLVAYLSLTQSPNIDETAHIASGMAVWDYGAFDLYCVNPPLVRAIASVPATLFQKDAVPIPDCDARELRPEFECGRQFVELNPDTWFLSLVCGRLMLIPLSVIGGYFCYRWCADLYGYRAGFVAMFIWCFSPDVLTWSSVITTDAAASSLGVAAGYYYWRWLKTPRWRLAVGVGLLLGAAELTKATWIILFALWPAMWICSTALCSTERKARTQLVVILLIGLTVLNFGYLCGGSFTCGSEYDFHSQLFRRVFHDDTLLSNVIRRIPIPLPYEYVCGIDIQRLDFEKGRPSFLLGEWRESGWWYYYIVAALVKEPCGTLFLFVLSTLLLHPPSRAAIPLRRRFRDGLALWTPAMGVFVIVSSQDGFSVNFRYILPALPFFLIWLGRAALVATERGRAYASVVAVMLTWSFMSSVFIYPHSMSYFNEIAGGPRNGHQWVNGTTLSWSQDCLRLQRWLEAHPDIDTPYVAVEWAVPLSSLGIIDRGKPPDEARDLVPGCYVVSTKLLHGQLDTLSYFRDYVPVAEIGYSILVYDFNAEVVRQIRRDFGVSPDGVLDRRSLINELRNSQSVKRAVRTTVLLVDKSRPTRDEAHVLKVLEASRLVDVSVATAADIHNGILAKCDVIVVPGGDSRVQSNVLCETGRDCIRRFVRLGGGYVGVCAGARLAASGDDWAIALVNAQPTNGKRFTDEVGEVNIANRGFGVVRIRFTKEGRTTFPDAPDGVPFFFSGGPVFVSATHFELPEYLVLATYASEIYRYPFQVHTMIDRPAIIASRWGLGHVLLFGCHPEASPGMEKIVVDAVRSCALAAGTTGNDRLFEASIDRE